MTKFYIGTAGWSYLKWDKEFYPKGIKADEKLAYYSTQFNAVELNNSFYYTPSSEQFANWESQAPASFQIAVKASRYITHVKKLKDSAETLPKFLDIISLKKPGPIFFQLPPNFPLNLDRLKEFLKYLPKTYRYAIELRDPSWHDEAVYKLLKAHKVAFCMFDIPEGTSPRKLTTDFAYVKLRGRKGKNLEGFLSEWKNYLSGNTKKAYVFFDNREEKKLAFGNALIFRDLTK